jgi:hypothetical protein
VRGGAPGGKGLADEGRPGGLSTEGSSLNHTTIYRGVFATGADGLARLDLYLHRRHRCRKRRLVEESRQESPARSATSASSPRGRRSPLSSSSPASMSTSPRRTAPAAPFQRGVQRLRAPLDPKVHRSSAYERDHLDRISDQIDTMPSRSFG